MTTWTEQELPRATRDLERLAGDLDAFGYCLIAKAVPETTIRRVRERIAEQAEAERLHGHSRADDVQSTGGDDGNQYVYMLINKGRIFQTLLAVPLVHSLLRHVVGDHYLLSDFAAIITHPGNRRMGLHIDQWFLPTPEPFGRACRKAGSITRRNLHTGPPSAATAPINPPVVCNVLWMVSDFSVENGATRLVPMSHASGCHPDPSRPQETVNVTGPAGTALVFEGRMWHGADLNRSNAPRYGVSTYYCAPQLRQMANFTYGTRPEVVESMPSELLSLLGFKPWGGYGATGDPGAPAIVRGEDALGELSPERPAR